MVLLTLRTRFVAESARLARCAVMPRMLNSVGKVFLSPDDKAAWKSCVRKRMGCAIKVLQVRCWPGEGRTGGGQSCEEPTVDEPRRAVQTPCLPTHRADHWSVPGHLPSGAALLGSRLLSDRDEVGIWKNVPVLFLCCSSNSCSTARSKRWSGAPFWQHRRIGTAPTKTTSSARSSGKDVSTRHIMLRTHPLPRWLGEWPDGCLSDDWSRLHEEV